MAIQMRLVSMVLMAYALLTLAREAHVTSAEPQFEVARVAVGAAPSIGSDTPSLDQIKARLKQQRQKVQSLYLKTIEETYSPLSAEELRKLPGFEQRSWVRKVESEFAFKGQKGYVRKREFEIPEPPPLVKPHPKATPMAKAQYEFQVENEKKRKALDVSSMPALRLVARDEMRGFNGRVLWTRDVLDRRHPDGRLVKGQPTVEGQRETLRETLSADELAHFESLVRSLPAFVTSMTMHNPHDIQLDRDQLNKRDKAMAELIAGAARGPLSHGKIIVLSASAHLLAGMGGVDFSREKTGVASMGDNLRDAFGANQVYTIVFEAHSGKTGTYPGNPIREASPRSVPGLLHKVGDPYRFLDLSQLPENHWLRRTRIGTWATAYYLPDGRPVILPDICDAVFYIDELRPMR